MNFQSKSYTFTDSDKTIVIAEVGVNHNRSLETARKMVDVAKSAGVDIIKFQLFDSEKEVSVHADKAAYQVANTTDDEGKNQLEMCKALELSQNDVKEMMAYCAKIKMPFLCTAFERYSLDYLVDVLGVKTIKIPSPEVTNMPFLRQIGRKKVAAILSTGASTLAEVGTAIKILQDAGCPELLLLHCVSQYPTPADEVNLRAMETMHQAFGLPVGFSDHTEGIAVDIAAAALGAAAIEKHFTLDRTMKGPDHKASIEPDELKALVSGVRATNAALGNGIKVPAPCEALNLPLIRKSLVAAVAIKKGTRITEDLLEIKRPLGGIDPGSYDNVIGLTVNRDIEYDELIRWSDLA